MNILIKGRKTPLKNAIVISDDMGAKEIENDSNT